MAGNRNVSSLVNNDTLNNLSKSNSPKSFGDQISKGNEKIVNSTLNKNLELKDVYKNEKILIEQRNQNVFKHPARMETPKKFAIRTINLESKAVRSLEYMNSLAYLHLVFSISTSFENIIEDNMKNLATLYSS